MYLNPLNQPLLPSPDLLEPSAADEWMRWQTFLLITHVGSAEHTTTNKTVATRHIAETKMPRGV